MSKDLGSVQDCQPGGERSHTFLLRCWLEPGSTPEGAPAWRFSLTQIETRRKKKGFTTLESVMAYIAPILLEKNHITSEGKQS